MSRNSSFAEEQLDALSDEKAELLRLLLEKKSGEHRRLLPYPRSAQDVADGLPASWAQQRLWFIDRLEGSSAYYASASFRIRGTLVRVALEEAFHAVILRHEVLRTAFWEEAGEPRQKVLADTTFSLQTFDLSHRNPAERDSFIQRFKVADVQQPFDLASGRLLRATLFTLQPDEHVLLVTMHHIVGDGWSLGVLFDELAELYSAKVSGRPDSLRPLTLQYGDYARWQRETLQGAALDEQLAWWREHLTGAPPQLELPLDRPRPPTQTHRGSSVSVSLDSELTRELKACARRRGMTPFMLLYAAWSVLLFRLSGQEDIVIGTPVANREHEDLEGLIGFFVNTLAVRARLSSQLTVEELLKQVRETMRGAYDHQTVPFERVVEAIQPQRSLSRNPLFQVMIALQNARQSALAMTGLEVVPEEEPQRAAMFDLHLLLEERGEEIRGCVNFASDLFDRETVARWLTSFVLVLRGVLRAPGSRLADLPLLSDAERKRVLVELNATQAPYRRDALIHQLFEEQVRRTPAAVALFFENRAITYAELNERSNQLARYLIRHGVGPDQLVAICVERSVEMVVGLLGILKAGGAYVPVDPGYPRERISYMLQDAASNVLLTQHSLSGKLPSAAAARVILLDTGWDEIAAESTESPDSAAMGLRSTHLAYVIYTSGSTGQPKGAMNEHHALINRLSWMQNEYRLTGRDRVLQKTPFSFDVSVWEFFWTLMSGATLVIAKPQGHQDPAYLRALINDTSVTTLHFVPSMLQAFLDQSGGCACPSLRRVICSGEELPPGLVRRHFERLPHVQLHNLYGPTEAAIDVTAGECRGDQKWNRTPIGRPIWNTQMYVLDEAGQPVPIGVSGEIHIGGVGVGRGYFRRADLTAQRFISDPFSDEPDARLYKTGDLGRWRADGALEYLGRNDHQAKIRGYRIEPGEIEAQLRTHESVREAVVLVREDLPGEKRLVAYVVSSVAGCLANLREYLKSRVPEYMVPVAWVQMEKLPLTPNGKLDRKGLPMPEGREAAGEYVAPRTELERTLARIWEEVLRIDKVGIHDNFFELGGHSLLATRVLTHINQEIDIELPLRAMFEDPTVDALSRRVVQEMTVGVDTETLTS